MRETWFVLEDGAAGNPAEIASDKDGVLRHKDGRAVAMTPHGPRSRGVDPEEEMAKAKADKATAKADKDAAAEAAAGRAADLGRNAEGDARAVADDDPLHRVAVAELDLHLLGAVGGDLGGGDQRP